MVNDSELKVFSLAVKDKPKQKGEPEWILVNAKSAADARRFAQDSQVRTPAKEGEKEVSGALNPWSKERSTISDITRRFPKLRKYGEGVINEVKDERLDMTVHECDIIEGK